MQVFNRLENNDRNNMHVNSFVKVYLIHDELEVE